MTDLELHVNAKGRKELVKQVREKIKELGIQYIYYQFVSVTGRIVGKGVPADHWESVAERGFQLVYGSTANLFVDRHKNYIGYGPEASELVGDRTGRTAFRPFPLTAGKLYDEPTELDRYQMIRTYFRMLIEEELPDAVGKMKQFASWFTHGVPGGAGLRKAIYESKSAVEILGRVEEFFEGRLNQQSLCALPEAAIL